MREIVMAYAVAAAMIAGLPPSPRTIPINRHRLPAAVRKRRDKETATRDKHPGRRRSVIANPERKMCRLGSKIITG